MAEKLFGTDGIRRRAGVWPLDPSGIMAIGMAAGTEFAEQGGHLLIGYDTRISSPHTAAGLALGITAVGMDAKNIGVVPTPGLAYLTRESDAAAGVMVTASHNPYMDNGIKIFDARGGKLSDETQDSLSRMIKSGVPPRDFGEWVHSPASVRSYLEFLVDSAAPTDFAGLRIGIDAANGAASDIADRVFGGLQADVVSMFDKPDGYNINAQCGAMHTESLREAVVEQELDIGLAVDGDADRALLVDELGRELTGDHIIYLLARARGYGGVVVTHMTNSGAERAMREAGIDVVRTDIGDRYVLQGLEETGYPLGGEDSGHVVLPHLLATGDGMLTAIQVIKEVRETGISLAEWRDQVPLLPMSLVNIPLEDLAVLQHPDVVAHLTKEEERFAAEGRFFGRPSGTQPLYRIMVESPNAEADAQQAALDFKKLIARVGG